MHKSKLKIIRKYLVEKKIKMIIGKLLNWIHKNKNSLTLNQHNN